MLRTAFGVAGFLQLVRLLIGLHEVLAPPAIGRLVSRMNDGLRSRPEDGEQRLRVARLHRGRRDPSPRLRAAVGLLSRRLLCGQRRARRMARDSDRHALRARDQAGPRLRHCSLTIQFETDLGSSVQQFQMRRACCSLPSPTASSTPATATAAPATASAAAHHLRARAAREPLALARLPRRGRWSPGSPPRPTPLNRRTGVLHRQSRRLARPPPRAAPPRPPTPPRHPRRHGHRRRRDRLRRRASPTPPRSPRRRDPRHHRDHPRRRDHPHRRDHRTPPRSPPP